MIAAPIVIVVPVDFEMPAGLSEMASPPSADATPVPARAVDTAPAPGRSNPPAMAVPDTHNPTETVRTLGFIECVTLPQRRRDLPAITTRYLTGCAAARARC